MLANLALCLFAAVPEAQEPALSESVHRLPQQELQVIDRRYLDTAAGTIRRQTVLSDGTPVDLQALRAEERRLAEANGGKVSPELRARMNSADPQDILEVVFWLRCDDSPDFREILIAAEDGGMDGESARRLARDTAEGFFAERIGAFAERLEAGGVEITQLGGAWPLVFTRISVASIEAWAADPAADMAYFVFPTWMSEIDIAQGTMRTPSVWDRGNTGAGSPVKVMVNDVGDVSGSNPDLPPITYLTTGNTSSHATGVAGNIAFDHPTYKGAAFGLPLLYSAGGTGDNDAPPIWNSAITAGVSFGNCSWWNGNKGQIVFLDRFFDYTLRNFAVMMFKSTGNQGNTAEPYTTTPGNGYNSTNSGAYNDADNVDWSDDAMASYSSYWDPIEGHEKPEVANAGDGVITAGTSSTQSFGGTSSASPLTCGVATLLASRDTSLMTRPEALKAILMVSAWHNVEGDDVLSEFDGAGAIHALAADSVVRDGQFDSATINNGTFNAQGHINVPFQAYAGDETRVVVLWFSNADSGQTIDMLDLDLDLVVLDPSNNVVATSASALNPFEIAKFTPTVSGTHRIRLVRQRFDGTSERVAVAWSSRQDAAEADVSFTGTTGIGDTFTINFRNRYDNSAPAYLAHASASTLPFTVGIGDGMVLPLRIDAAWNFAIGRPGFSGFLSPAGQASAVLTLPNRPSLVGREFYIAFYTFIGGIPSTILDTSEPASFVVGP